MRVFPLVFLLIPLLAAAQDDTEGRRLSKAEERAKFHPRPVRGTSAEERQRAFERRLAAERDSRFGGLNWRNIGPEVQGGRVVDLDIPTDNPKQLYVATATGGLWRTENEGLTWTSLFDDHSSYGIGAIAVSRDGKTLWVGTGEANSQRTSYAGTGVFKSVDGGATWSNVGLPESHHIGRIAIDPSNPDVVYVAALGHLYSQNPERGLYKTADGGKSWKQILKVDEYTGAVDVVVNPAAPSQILVSMWDRDRRAWNFREAGAGSAVFRSTDGGARWQKVETLPIGDAAGRIGLAVGGGRSSTVYALVDNQSFDPEWDAFDERVPSGRLTPRRFLLLSAEQFASLDKGVLEPFWRRYGPESLKLEDALAGLRSGSLSMEALRKRLEERDPNLFTPGYVEAEVYRSNDFGATFRKTKLGRLGGIGGYYWGKVAVNPRDADDVFVMGVPLLRSTDGGETWRRAAPRSHVDYHAVQHDPRDPQKVWIGSDGGLYLSHDGGLNVRHINNLPLAQATTLALDNKTPYNVYLGLQDNGTMKGPSTYVPGRSDPDQWKTLMGGDGSDIAIDPRDNGDVVYAASQFGGHAARNQKTGEGWSTRANPPAGDPPARYNWISPLIVSSHHPDIVYLGAQRVYRSFNMGRKWEPISPDITKNLPNGDVPYSTIKELSESPLRFGLIYAGCDDGTIKMTPDGGFQWIDVSTPQKDKWVSGIVASRHDVGTVYASQSGYREDDFATYLWRSKDFGRTWASIAGDLPSETVNVVREDPWRKDVLYVGTDMGVFVSIDGGGHWETLHGGMPNLPVHDLAIQEREKDLVAATHARGAYVLSLKPLDKLQPAVLDAPLTLFPIEEVKRQPTWGYERRERWDTTPPRVPTASFMFWTHQAGSAVLKVRNQAGETVIEKQVAARRGFNEVEVGLLIRPGKPIQPDPAKVKPKTAEEALKDPYEDSRGVYLAAGEYVATVEAGGKSSSQTLKVTN
ncbi:MAG TPA: hypothetical protein VGE01_02675 [Fimbriimonas sp.]